MKDPTDNTKATCSLSGILNGVGTQCIGQSSDELKLTITVGESSAVCDLDRQQVKTRLNAWSSCSGEYIYPVEGKSSGLGFPSCDLISAYPIMYICTGEEVTLTSMGEDDPTCIYEALLTAPNPSTSPSKSPSSNPTEVPTGSPSKEVILLSRFLEDILSSHPSSHITHTTHSSRLFFVHNIHFSADTEPKQVTLKSSNGKLCLLCWMESFSTS